MDKQQCNSYARRKYTIKLGKGREEPKVRATKLEKPIRKGCILQCSHCMEFWKRDYNDSTNRIHIMSE